jgi:hypothetical protein
MILTGNATPEASDWSDDLLGALLQPHVFAVAPRVVSPGRQVVDGGFVQVDDDLVPLVHGRSTPDSVFGCFEWVRNVDSLSGRAMMCRTSDCLALLNGLDALSQVGVFVGLTAIRDASRNRRQVALVWSHTTFVITGSREPVTSFGNPQLERISGAILPTRGFDASYGSNGESAW